MDSLREYTKAKAAFGEYQCMLLVSIPLVLEQAIDEEKLKRKGASQEPLLLKIMYIAMFKGF